MKKLYYDDPEEDSLDFFEENGFITEEDMFDDPEQIIAEEQEKLKELEPEVKSTRLTSVKPIQASKNLLAALRTELGFLEPDRGVLLFRADGIDYEGVPMLEINPNKFVFKVTSNKGDKEVMKAFLLSNIRLK